jgi:hypothetical protein
MFGLIIAEAHRYRRVLIVASPCIAFTAITVMGLHLHL